MYSRNPSSFLTFVKNQRMRSQIQQPLLERSKSEVYTLLCYPIKYGEDGNGSGFLEILKFEIQPSQPKYSCNKGWQLLCSCAGTCTAAMQAAVSCSQGCSSCSDHCLSGWCCSNHHAAQRLSFPLCKMEAKINFCPALLVHYCKTELWEF